MLQRHDKVGWDRNKVELSAGEQLWEEDLKAANPFAAWMTRGILEEFFPSKGLPQVMLDRIKKEFFG